MLPTYFLKSVSNPLTMITDRVFAQTLNYSNVPIPGGGWGLLGIGVKRDDLLLFGFFLFPLDTLL